MGDRDLVQGRKDFVDKCKEVLGKRRKNLRIMEERLFHGMESNTVVYIGAGHMEALTRAQLHLYIVTMKTKQILTLLGIADTRMLLTVLCTINLQPIYQYSS